MAKYLHRVIANNKITMKNLILILFVFSFYSCQSQGWQKPKKKVLVLAMDGLRADVLEATPTPNIDRLRAIGVTYDRMQVDTQAWTAHGFADAWTGVNSAKHGIYTNPDINVGNNNLLNFPVFIDLIEAYDSNLKTYFTSEFIGNFRILGGTPDNAFHFTLVRDGSTITNAIVNRLQNFDDDVLVWRVSNPDKAGHQSAFDFVPEYQDTLMLMDYHLGRLLDALAARKQCEDWLIVFHTDHGGYGNAHGRSAFDPRENEVTVIFAGDAISVKNTVKAGGHIVDITPTILEWLSIPIPNYCDGVSRLNN